MTDDAMTDAPTDAPNSEPPSSFSTDSKVSTDSPAPPPDAGDWVALLGSPLPADRAMAHVADARAGGVNVFLGTTRGETNGQGRELLALDYEAYAGMAGRQLNDLARRARQRWPIVRLALLHRTGRVKPAEPSVLIAVATPHRAEAFEACRWLIDTLKAELAVWKKEIWAGGEETWVEGQKAGEGEMRNPNDETRMTNQ